MGVRPSSCVTWLVRCCLLARHCCGTRVPGHPRDAGLLFDHYVNHGSSPRCGAVCRIPLLMSDASRGGLWLSTEGVVEHVPCERIVVVLAAGVVVGGEGGECVADAYERGDFCVLDRFLDRVYGSLFGDVCCDVVEALCGGFEVE